MKAVASAPGWTIEVMSQSHAWSFDVGIPDSRQAVEAVKKSRTFPEVYQSHVNSWSAVLDPDHKRCANVPVPRRVDACPDSQVV